MLRLLRSTVSTNPLSMKLPDLSIKLHHRYVWIGKNHSIYRVWYARWFQASTGSWNVYVPSR